MEENKNGKFRQKRVNFSLVSNSALRDVKLSLKAKGLYSLIQSYITIEEFTLYKWYLKNQCIEGTFSFDSAWKEIKDRGYLKQYRMRNPDTRRYYYEYELLDIADTDTPSLINVKSKSEPPHFPSGFKTNEVQTQPSTKQPLYSNTKFNNTLVTNTLSKPTNKFNNFPQRNYTKSELSSMEQALLSKNQSEDFNNDNN